MVLTLVTCVVCVLLCVAVHLGFLLLVYRLVSPRLKSPRRAALGLIVLFAIVARLVEISLFAAGYTSLGDNQPETRELRLMTAVEALTGLVLITWAARSRSS